MSFSENLLYLRKKAKITQEELADELAVSRQSVSKWETGESYPETEKLIALCDKFGVSMDEMVRGNLCVSDGEAEKEQAESVQEPSEEVSEPPVFTDFEGYKKLMNTFSRNIAIGVFLILLGVSVCVLLGGLSTMFEGKTENIIAVSGGIAVLLFVAPAVFLFIFSGITKENYVKKNPNIDGVFTTEEKEKFDKKFVIAIACLVTAILLDVIALIVAFAVLDSFKPSQSDMFGCVVTASFLFVLSFIVGGLCYTGIRRDMYYYQIEGVKSDGKKSERMKISDGICGAIMLTATAVFLLIGFVWNLWHPGWVVFPIGGILCGVVSTIAGCGKK